jgi:ABC-type sugar transport system ATPase subunit
VIALENVSIASGLFRLDGVSFEIPAGQYGVLMGKTGSGKTTILEAVAGLRWVAAGRVLLDGRDVTALPPAGRGIGYVPQDRALFGTMTVREHLAFALEVRRRRPDEIARRVDELAGLLGIGSLLDRKPQGLSGGEAQRVALGRALSAAPGILLLDEPLTALDDDTKDDMMELLLSVKKRLSVTTLHVTHSVNEALRLADRMFVLREGRLVEGKPADLEERRS